jgi:AraC-like DNA-binding protein
LESGGRSDVVQRLDRAQDLLTQPSRQLASLHDLDKFLLNIVAASAELCGAVGGAYGSLSASNRELHVHDCHASIRSPGDRSCRSFVLPVGPKGSSGWQKILEHDRTWSAELGDARFTEGFRDYHRPAQRTFFFHFPILLSGEARGFLGLSFVRHRKLTDLQLRTGQIMVTNAGIAMHLAQLAAPTFHDSGSSPADGGINADFARRVEAHIDQMIGESRWSSLSTRGLADHFGYSPRHFHTRFVNSFGQSPHAFAVDRRLSMAFECVLAGEAGSQVAIRFGFADQAHFARRIRAKFGCSPSEASTRARS